jgi:hypothetical protein
MEEQSKLHELSRHFREYLNTHYELVKLQVLERLSVIGSGLASSFIIGVILLLFVLFLSIAVGFYVSSRYGDNYTGFLFVAGFYFLVAIILLIGRKKLIEKPIRDKIIRKAFQDN